jgi:hypothetical protein
MTKLPAASLMLLFICISWFACKTNRLQYKPIRLTEDENKERTYPPFKRDEILIFFKGAADAGKSKRIKDSLHAAGIDTAILKIRKCNDCDPYVELWQGPNIHTFINGGGITGGSGGKTKGVGEDDMAWYSVNYINEIPEGSPRQTPGFEETKITPPSPGTGKDTITVAILDTGIDTVRWVSGANLWVNNDKKDNTDDDNNCYIDDINGWNFIDSNNNINDDNPSIHGSIISQYIVNEFAHSTKNFLQLMILKTHDRFGRGDLFTNLCAINYAKKKGANIINASWGFYYYYDAPHPMLTQIITDSLAANGILFIAAAGNQTAQSDAEARAIYQEQNPGVVLPDHVLRNLAFHSFYPGILSEPGKNVITVTTSNTDTVSITQNYSSKFVDLAVIADTVLPSRAMHFRAPFAGNANRTISGSSFATAIATGKIGAFLDKSVYAGGISKLNCFSNLSSIINTSNPLKTRNLIGDGRYIKRE